ncbi:DnaJ family domain-containing protein [Luteipulveratus flavus]|uniref:DUF1992 domain-containing protein n=1 Tax=Luteipulveratus flavus TaxID=3031728 RepID=A0ABT6CC74_9MICO|nr:DUF1992 domain-containing protein [Luteipulveratus sp. YIM 133296]MDF8265967.1 DUF1992 domain-containing protein [Luteipulveratus sp. YIM 133296]
MGYREGHIDRVIRDAQARGDFDNLPGAGKPLDLGDMGDPDWWVKRWVRREGIDTSQALPGPLALRKEREGFPESLADLATEQSVRVVLQDFNRRVRDEVLRPTFGRLSRPVVVGVDVEAMVLRWRELRAEHVAASPAPAPVVPAPRRRRWWWPFGAGRAGSA